MNDFSLVIHFNNAYKMKIFNEVHDLLNKSRKSHPINYQNNTKVIIHTFTFNTKGGVKKSNIYITKWWTHVPYYKLVVGTTTTNLGIINSRYPSSTNTLS